MFQNESPGRELVIWAPHLLDRARRKRDDVVKRLGSLVLNLEFLDQLVKKPVQPVHGCKAHGLALPFGDFFVVEVLPQLRA